MKTQESPRAASPGAVMYTVQQYVWPLWHDVLSTGDRAKAYALKDRVGEKARVVEAIGKQPAKTPADRQPAERNGSQGALR